MSDENQKDNGATHGLHDTVASLHRSLKKAERMIQQGSEKSGYSITHFEIDFPAQLHINPHASDAADDQSGEGGGLRDAAKAAPEEKHAFLTLPKTRALRSADPADSGPGLEAASSEGPESSIPQHHLSRLKIVLRKEIKMAED